MALQGFGFEISVEIVPVPSGGGSNRWFPEPQEYAIVVKVSYKGKTWYQQKIVNHLTGRSLEKVVVTFKKITKSAIKVISKLNNILKTQISIRTRRSD